VRFFAWPSAAHLRLSLLLVSLFSLLMAVVYGGASWLTTHRDPPPVPSLPQEAAIPFVPLMAVVYLSVPLFQILTPLVLRTWRELVPFFFTSTAMVLVAGLVYLASPFSLSWPPPVATGPGAGLFRFMDVINLEYNQLPSLHLAFSTSMALVFGRRRGPAGKVLLWLWVAAVALSTLMTHQHHLLDLITGSALAFLAVATVQRWTEQDSFLDALRIEALCLRELAFFTRRHPRYLLTGLAIWGYSLRRWTETRLLRAGFCLTQHIDDVLDGDRPVSGDPVAYARGLLRGEPGPVSPLGPLAAFVLGDLDRRGGRESLEQLVDVLIEDRRRMDARRPLPAAELAAHHRRTFQLSLDLTLIAAGSALRAGDAPDLVEALAWCSPVRDLEEDLAKGLINIPAEVLAQTGGGGNDPRALLAAEPVRDWLRAEHARAAGVLNPDRPSRQSPSDPGHAVLAAFHRALTTYERRYRHAHRHAAL
jgi:membrane-associated phospholipid phosphatase